MPDEADAKQELCFGCGADNPHGLHIQYEVLPDGASATTLNLSWEHSGEPGLVHGGIQATILDEVMGHAAQRAVSELAGERRVIVTASFELRYRSPCPTGQPITGRGYVDRVEWPSVFVAGKLTAGDGTLLTEATARWRVIDEGPS